MRKLTLQIVLILLCGSLNAQQSFMNKGNLQIHTGASVSGFGNFSNTSTAVLINNGNLYVKGNITNDQASMATGAGTLYLNGSASQSVAGSQVLKTYHLNSNNSAGIVLNNNLSVAGIHTFANGLIATSASPNFLIYEAGSSYTGSTDTRHVTGWVKKIGNTDFSFPVGDASYLRAAALQNFSASSEFNCHYYTPAQNLSGLTIPIRLVKANEYWQINKISGGTARVALNWDHSKVAMDNVLMADIVTGYYSAGTWHDDGGTASGNVLTTGNITSNIIASFGPFTFAYKTFPVPLTLISFTAERRQGTSYLHWVTDNEQNVSHFDIQRSYDVGNYSTIGNIPARNRGSQEQYYIEDHSPLKGYAWYRIRSVDLDGKFSYTKIAVVSEMDSPANSFLVLNPVQNAITIFNKTGNAGSFNYSLFNQAGQLILKGNINMTSNGEAVLPLPSQVASGIYILEINDDVTRFRQKLLVKK
jgi:hypothetical protein